MSEKTERHRCTACGVTLINTPVKWGWLRAAAAIRQATAAHRAECRGGGSS